MDFASPAWLSQMQSEWDLNLCGYGTETNSAEVSISNHTVAILLDEGLHSQELGDLCHRAMAAQCLPNCPEETFDQTRNKQHTDSMQSTVTVSHLSNCPLPCKPAHKCPLQ